MQYTSFSRFIRIMHEFIHSAQYLKKTTVDGSWKRNIPRSGTQAASTSPAAEATTSWRSQRHAQPGKHQSRIQGFSGFFFIEIARES